MHAHRWSGILSLIFFWNVGTWMIHFFMDNYRYIFSFAIGAGPVTGIIIPELSSTRTRGKIMGFSFSTHWVCVRTLFISWIWISQLKDLVNFTTGQSNLNMAQIVQLSNLKDLSIEDPSTLNLNFLINTYRFAISWLDYSFLSWWRNLELHQYMQALEQFLC